MDNDDVAKMLDEIADLLDIEGESVFRVNAYRKAADSIRGLTEDINILHQEDRLENLPGIGKGIADKLHELLTKGKIEYHEELKEKVPPTLIELIQIPGLGPRKAKTLYEELNIQTIDDLLNAVQAHWVAPLKGFGVQTEENILRGIKQFRKGRERILLSEAYSIAQKMLGEIKEASFVLKADTAGSLRRMKETIGDIDLLVASTEPQKVMDFFCGLSLVEQVLAKGDTKTSVIAKNGLQVDLRVVEPEQYGSALQYFTGSKEHNIHLRDIAKKQGLKINEYGVFEVASERRVGGDTEEGIYTNLGMQYIPALIREDKGEIELALEDKLPHLIQQEDIRGDLHVHSSWSDGFNSIEEMVKAAQELGYFYIAICDHAEKLKVAGGLSKEAVRLQKEEIDRINQRIEKFRILSGIELNIDNNGNLDYEDDLLKDFDIVVASIHTGFNQPEELLTKRMISAIRNPNVDIIAHPTGRVLGRRSSYALELEAVFKAAVEHDTFLELNSYPDRLDLKDDYLREAKKHGVKIAINTDAHTVSHLRYMSFGIATAQRGWLEAEDVVNTYPLEQLMEILINKSK